MKLLICTQTVDKNDPILGFFHGWLLEFAKHFSEIHVICLKQGQYELPENVYVYSLGKELGVSRIRYGWRFYKYFIHIFFKVRVDIVFYHMGAIYNVLAVPFFMLRSWYQTRFLWWKAHGHINRFGRFALWFCDEVVTSTASGFPIKSKKRHIVGQAIDTTLFHIDEKIERKAKHVIYVGRIAPIKQLETFIDIARVLEPVGYTFSVAGPAYDEGYFEGLRQQAADTSIDWLGPKTQSELVGLYQQTDIFLNTSLTHSMDKTVLEAILCGCIPVTANQAFRELLEPHGLFLSSPSVHTYTTVLTGLSSSNRPEVRRALAEEVAQLHSLDTFTERVFDVG